MVDMDPEAAADRAMGRKTNRETAEERQRDEEPTEDSSSESSESLNLGEMLKSTQPDRSPREVSGSLDFTTPWHAHAEVAFEKATNARGTPAWVHLLMAAFLLLASEFNLPLPGGDSDGADDGDRGDDADGDGPGGAHAI